MDSFVVRTSTDEEEKLDKQVGRFFFSQNIPFRGVDNPQFKSLCTQLRPGYLPPNRKRLGGAVLNSIYQEVEEKINNKLKQRQSVLV